MRIKTLIGIILGMTAIYFPTANWLDLSYAKRKALFPNVPGEKFLLQRPFLGFSNSQFAAVGRDYRFGKFADTAESEDRSDIELYEEDKRLGPGHTTPHADIGALGLGRFSHWRYNYSAIIFSSSDNTDPRTNGRNYWVVKPEKKTTTNGGLNSSSVQND